ncbi:MAG: hypothetical protein ACXWMC_06840 [Syntrophales bacterium]
MKNPKAKMWFELIIASVLIGLALFLSAGTINYWQAWVYLGISAVSGVLLTLAIIKDPVLLENRTKRGPAPEQRPIQKIIVLCTGLPAIAAFIIPGLDRRFAWSSVPSWLSIVSDILIIISMWMVYRVFKENSFGSTTVEIVKNQKVITTALTRLCGIRCIQARQCTSLRCHWRLAPIGDSSLLFLLFWD